MGYAPQIPGLDNRGPSAAVLTTAQTLDTGQQEQARTNINALSADPAPSFYAVLATATPITNDGNDYAFSTSGGKDQTVELDTTGDFDGSTGTFTVPEAGVYRFECNVQFNSIVSTTRITLSIFVNGTKKKNICDTYTPTMPFRHIGFVLVVLEAGDEVRLGYNVTGTNPTTTISSAEVTESIWAGTKM